MCPEHDVLRTLPERDHYPVIRVRRRLSPVKTAISNWNRGIQRVRIAVTWFISLHLGPLDILPDSSGQLRRRPVLSDGTS